MIHSAGTMPLNRGDRCRGRGNEAGWNHFKPASERQLLRLASIRLGRIHAIGEHHEIHQRHERNTVGEERRCFQIHPSVSLSQTIVFSELPHFGWFVFFVVKSG